MVVGGPESPTNVLVVEHLNLEGEVFLKVFEDHDEEGQLDAQRLASVCGARDEGGGDVRAHDFEHRRLDVLIGDSLDVSVADLLVPYLQWFRPAMCRRAEWDGDERVKCEKSGHPVP